MPWRPMANVPLPPPTASLAPPSRHARCLPSKQSPWHSARTPPNMSSGCVLGPVCAGAPPPGAPGAAAGGAARAAGTAACSAPSGMPLIRYSTARSGLLNAARIARTTSSRGKPISQTWGFQGREPGGGKARRWRERGQNGQQADKCLLILAFACVLRKSCKSNGDPHTRRGPPAGIPEHPESRAPLLTCAIFSSRAVPTSSSDPDAA